MKPHNSPILSNLIPFSADRMSRLPSILLSVRVAVPLIVAGLLLSSLYLTSSACSSAGTWQEHFLLNTGRSS
jgi:hypothetical protein